MTTAERIRELVRYEPDTGHFYSLRTGKKRFSTPNVFGYLRLSVDGKNYTAHRLAWLYVHGAWPNVVDHINGNPADNRLCNLRSVTPAENRQNQQKVRSSSKTGFIGVRFKRNRFIALLFIDGKKKEFGRFLTAEEAHASYLEAKRKHYPAFAG